MCQICIEPYTIRSRSCISCHFCQTSCCSQCTQKYLLSSNKIDCMFCHHTWSLIDLTQLLPRSFIQGPLKKHQKNILYENEKTMFPVGLQYINIKNNIKSVVNEMKDIREKTTILQFDDLVLIKQLRLKRKRLHQLLNTKTLLVNCPNDICDGFIDFDYCTKCNYSMCILCYGIKEDNHMCNPDVLANVQHINSSTKHCPSCHVPIFKTEGCNQVWCTRCHIAFDWKTLQIQDGIIHNPHYLEENREPIALPDLISCIDLWYNHDIPQTIVVHLCGIYDDLFLFQDTISSFNKSYDALLNNDARIHFLEGHYTEKQFQCVLYRRFKKAEFDTQVRNILKSLFDSILSFLKETVTLGLEIQEIRTLLQQNAITQEKIQNTSQIYQLQMKEDVIILLMALFNKFALITKSH